MRIVKLFIIALLMCTVGTAVNAQCVNFARLVVKPQLEPFTHDGNYNATLLEEGESVELSKTFFSGEEYRLVLGVVDALPKNIRIRILNSKRQVVFDNADHKYTYVWDFRPETTDNLLIHIKIPEDENSDKIRGGCIAIMFGIKMSDKKKR